MDFGGLLRNIVPWFPPGDAPAPRPAAPPPPEVMVPPGPFEQLFRQAAEQPIVNIYRRGVGLDSNHPEADREILQRWNELAQREAALNSMANNPQASPSVLAMQAAEQHPIPVHMPPDQMPSPNVEDRTDPSLPYFGKILTPRARHESGPMADQLGMQDLLSASGRSKR